MWMGCGCGWDADAVDVDECKEKRTKKKYIPVDADVHTAPVKDGGGRGWVAEVLTQHVLWDLENFVQVCIATVHY